MACRICALSCELGVTELSSLQLKEDDWTDLVDECEDVFSDSACLKKFSDDGFEKWLKSECAEDVNKIMDK